MRNLVRRISSRTACSAAAALLIGVGGIAQAQVIDVGDASGQAGTTVQIPVNWDAGAVENASGLTVDIGFGDHPVDATGTNRPNCTLASAVAAVKTASGFSFRPAQCTVGTTCTAARAGIIDFGDNNATPVPEGEIYTCSFTIPSGANDGDTFEFSIQAASYVDPDGNETDITEASNGGTVSVVVAPPTATATPVPPEPTATNTAVPPTPTNTKPPGGGGSGDDDGCQVVAPANSSAAWLLMIPAAVLLWQRRRSR